MPDTLPLPANPGGPSRRAVWRQRVAWLLACGLGLAAAGARFDAARLRAGGERLGEPGAGRVAAWIDHIAALTAVPEGGRPAAMNDFVNRHVFYLSDLEAWGVPDRWNSPMETLGRGVGDCEDYAIAKYFGLVATGVAHRQLRLVYVRLQRGDGPQAHMVLAYFPRLDADPWVLDNLVLEAQPASRRPDLVPVFSFNAQALWSGLAESGAPDRPAQGLGPWAEVLRKARGEGF